MLTLQIIFILQYVQLFEILLKVVLNTITLILFNYLDFLYVANTVHLFHLKENPNNEKYKYVECECVFSLPDKKTM